MDLKLLVPRVKSAGAGSFFSEGGILHALRDAARIVCEDSLCSKAVVALTVPADVDLIDLQTYADVDGLTALDGTDLSWADVEPIKIEQVGYIVDGTYHELVDLPTPYDAALRTRLTGTKSGDGGLPTGFYDRYGKILIDTYPVAPLILRAHFAYRPGPETTIVDIPRQAELAIIYQALVSLLPLGTQVRQAAEVRARDYLADFTGSARTGTSGLFAATVRGGSFVGRKR